MDGRVWRAVAWTAAAMVTTSCGHHKEPKNGGCSTVEAEFKRCKDQEKYGEAKGCWHAFLDHFGDQASTAELAYAKEHIEKATTDSAVQPSRNTDDSVARAARDSGGLVRLQEKRKAGSSEESGNFPPQRVGYEECYKGFRVSGKPADDVAALGRLCGAPCGMTSFSGIVPGSQDENDNVDVYGITLRSDRCYRFIAVGENSIRDLDSAIADGEGNVLLRDVFNDAAPILGPKEPFCPARTGRYRYVVSVASGSGTFHFQVWQGPKR